MRKTDAHTPACRESPVLCICDHFTDIPLTAIPLPEPSLTDLVRAIVARRDAVLERICEAAVQSGQYGVLVIDPTLDPVISLDTIGDSISVTGDYIVEVSALIPYGHVFTFPSRAAVDNWVRNGRPS